MHPAGLAPAAHLPVWMVYALASIFGRGSTAWEPYPK
jgi:hypothetical protein